jgi:2-polyprenyl-3-methyl-5-hydroxy-6-metoxy-1,4-benzoquinol methylase
MVPERASRARSEREQHEVWEGLGREDPDWSVLTVPERRHGGWVSDLSQFYASGETEVSAVLASLPVTLGGRALDFGSGTGRLSFALSRHFDSVTCVDTSSAMLERLLERADTYGIRNLRPVLVDDLRPEGDHDLVVSLLVLQHLPSRRTVARAVGVLARCVRPGGWLVLEVPEKGLGLRQLLQPRWQVYRVARRLRLNHRRLHRFGLSGISMLTIPAPAMSKMIAEAGLEVVAQDFRQQHDYLYARWVIRRP